MQYPPHNISCSHVHYMRFIVRSNVIVLISQALMGIQLVVSLLAASIMQRMAPHASFARWLLCNGRYILHPHSRLIHYMHNVLGTVYIHVSVIPSSLFRFKHPSEGELCALAGKQMPKPNRRDRWESGEGMTQIRVPGETRHCLNHKSCYFFLQSSCSMSLFFACQ